MFTNLPKRTPQLFNLSRLPKDLQEKLGPTLETGTNEKQFLELNQIYQGDCCELLPKIRPNSVALSVWSPPYFVGKQYEVDHTFETWQELLHVTIARHFPIVQPGG